MSTIKTRIVPHLWFATEAREAADFYCGVFPNSAISYITTLRETPSGDCDVVSFHLGGQPFMAISAGPLFKFNEAISFIVNCDTQDEVDYYWHKLSAVPAAEQCGWLKDRYGLSWQIVPSAMDDMMRDQNPERAVRLMTALLAMKKLDLAALEKAYKGP